MLILGLNAYHGDSAACLLYDGRLVAAAEEERFRRIKHWAGLPTEAIKYCLHEAGASLGDLDHIALNRKPGANNWRRLCFLLRHRPGLALVQNRLGNIRAALSLGENLNHAFPGEIYRARLHYIEHHRAHLASGFLISGFRQATCVSVDGFGDFASTAWGFARDNSMSIDGRIYFPHSLGIFYSAITQHLGFPHFGDEYKVMGLAAYGEPRYLRRMRRILRVHLDGSFELNLSCFRHYRDDVSYSWNESAPSVGTLFTPELEQLLGPPRQSSDPVEPRHHDLAHSAQSMYEEALFALLNAVYRKYRSEE